MDTVAKITEVDGKDTSGSMVDKLAAMTDDQLLDILGWNIKLDSMKKDIGEMAKLTGKAREVAEKEVTRMLTPDVDSYRIKYALEDAQRAGKKGGKEGMCDCSPCSVLD